MNQNTETWEEDLRLKVNFDSNQDREVCILFIKTEIDRARQEGRDETIDYIRNHKHSEEAVKGLWYVSDDTFEAARQHKEG